LFTFIVVIKTIPTVACRKPKAIALKILKFPKSDAEIKNIVATKFKDATE
tara:strand:+ start:755 stop:904 length:150 start_codon:yes stop_codon:yes gene_type:complete